MTRRSITMAAAIVFGGMAFVATLVLGDEASGQSEGTVRHYFLQAEEVVARAFTGDGAADAWYPNRKHGPLPGMDL